MSKRPNLKVPAPVQEILARLLTPADRRQLELHSRLRQLWEQNVSPLWRENTELVDFSRKILYIEVTNNPWLQELHFAKPRILAAMQKELGEMVIQEIKFRLK